HGRDGLSSRVIRESNQAARRDRGISHRELADLGNERSKLLESLIDAVVQSGEIGRVRRMGLVRDVSDEQFRRRISPEELRPMLVYWTMKQVYTRFGKLRRQGFIESERPSSNGPIRLQLPEEIRGFSPEFMGLPSPEQVERLTVSRLTRLPGSDPRFPDHVVTRNP